MLLFTCVLWHIGLEELEHYEDAKHRFKDRADLKQLVVVLVQVSESGHVEVVVAREETKDAVETIVDQIQRVIL